MRRILLVLIASMMLVLPTRSGDYVSGSATCPASGNAQVSTTPYSLRQLTVSALNTNTGYVHLGGKDVSSTTGGILSPGASYNSSQTSNNINPAALYFACTVNTDGVG